MDASLLNRRIGGRVVALLAGSAAMARALVQAFLPLGPERVLVFVDSPAERVRLLNSLGREAGDGVLDVTVAPPGMGEMVAAAIRAAEPDLLVVAWLWPPGDPEEPGPEFFLRNVLETRAAVSALPAGARALLVSNVTTTREELPFGHPSVLAEEIFLQAATKAEASAEVIRTANLVEDETGVVQRFLHLAAEGEILRVDSGEAARSFVSAHRIGMLLLRMLEAAPADSGEIWSIQGTTVRIQDLAREILRQEGRSEEDLVVGEGGGGGEGEGGTGNGAAGATAAGVEVAPGLLRGRGPRRIPHAEAERWLRRIEAAVREGKGLRLDAAARDPAQM